MLHLLDTYAAGISLLCSALFECLAVSWFYGKRVNHFSLFGCSNVLLFLGLEKFCDDVENMIGHRPGLYWRICWKFISPMFIIVSWPTIFKFKCLLFVSIFSSHM
jgi:solute carrier family 6 noradrenalin transporter-like protein 2